MKFKRQSSEEVSVNLTPLIDVVFLLLIFFMVSTTFTRESQLRIELPEASGEESSVQADRIEVQISAGGEFAVNDTRLSENDRATLIAAIRDIAGSDTSMPFLVTADASTPHELVVRVMDVAGQMGFSGLSITTQRLAETD